MKMHLKISSVKWRSSCTGGNELKVDYARPLPPHPLIYPSQLLQETSIVRRDGAASNQVGLLLS